MEILKEFDTPYHQVGKHRKRCGACNKLIQDGDSVHMTKVRREKYYPIKGIMTFINWKFRHTTC